MYVPMFGRAQQLPYADIAYVQDLPGKIRAFDQYHRRIFTAERYAAGFSLLASRLRAKGVRFGRKESFLQVLQFRLAHPAARRKKVFLPARADCRREQHE